MLAAAVARAAIWSRTCEVGTQSPIQCELGVEAILSNRAAPAGVAAAQGGGGARGVRLRLDVELHAGEGVAGGRRRDRRGARSGEDERVEAQVAVAAVALEVVVEAHRDSVRPGREGAREPVGRPRQLDTAARPSERPSTLTDSAGAPAHWSPRARTTRAVAPAGASRLLRPVPFDQVSRAGPPAAAASATSVPEPAVHEDRVAEAVGPRTSADAEVAGDGDGREAPRRQGEPRGPGPQCWGGSAHEAAPHSDGMTTCRDVSATLPRR